MKASLILLILISCAIFTQAQDKIIKRNGDVIECKVLKIGSEEITYSLAEYDFSVEFEIEKSKVEKIVFENGMEHIIDHEARARESTEANSADLFLIQNKNAIKINFFSILNATTAFAYETALKPGQSCEFDLGIIGLGFDEMWEGNPIGLGLRAGYKFIRSPDYYLKEMRYSHILKGGYVKPELAFASYNLQSEDRNVTKGALFITLGKQYVFSDIFLLDIFGSLGYGFSNTKDNDVYPYYFAVADNDFPIALAWGLRIGFLF